MRDLAQRWGGALLGAAVGVVVVIALVAIGQIGTLVHAIRSQQITNTQVSATNAQTLEIIQSCTTPGRPCYERGKRATAAAVGQINRVVILAAACASQHPGATATQIQTCVVRGLAKQEAKK